MLLFVVPDRQEPHRLPIRQHLPVTITFRSLELGGGQVVLRVGCGGHHSHRDSANSPFFKVDFAQPETGRQLLSGLSEKLAQVVRQVPEGIKLVNGPDCHQPHSLVIRFVADWNCRFKSTIGWGVESAHNYFKFVLSRR